MRSLGPRLQFIPAVDQTDAKLLAEAALAGSLHHQALIRPLVANSIGELQIMVPPTRSSFFATHHGVPEGPGVQGFIRPFRTPKITASYF